MCCSLIILRWEGSGQWCKFLLKIGEIDEEDVDFPFRAPKLAQHPVPITNDTKVFFFFYIEGS